MPVREGDMIIVHSMDRFARSLKDLVTEIDQLVKSGVAIQFVKENITFTAQATPMDNLMLQLMGAFAQFEREIILERQKEGIKIAAAQGKYKGVSSRHLRKQYPEIKSKLWGGSLWSPSYFASSCGGAPLEIIKQYIEQQQSPH